MIQAYIRPRSLEAIETEIRGQERIVSALRQLATSFYMIDLRLLLVRLDTFETERVGSDPVPSDLRDMLATETDRLRQLVSDLHTVRATAHLGYSE